MRIPRWAWTIGFLLAITGCGSSTGGAGSAADADVLNRKKDQIEQLKAKSKGGRAGARPRA